MQYATESRLLLRRYCKSIDVDVEVVIHSNACDASGSRVAIAAFNYRARKRVNFGPIDEKVNLL